MNRISAGERIRLVQETGWHFGYVPESVRRPDDGVPPLNQPGERIGGPVAEHLAHRRRRVGSQKPIESVPLPNLEFRDGNAADRRPETVAADNIHSLAAVLAEVQSADSSEIVRLDAELQA